MSGFIALTKLCKIAGRVAVLLYRPSNGRSTSDPSWAASQQNTINKLDKTLKEWLEKDVVSARCRISPRMLINSRPNTRTRPRRLDQCNLSRRCCPTHTLPSSSPSTATFCPQTPTILDLALLPTRSPCRNWSKRLDLSFTSLRSNVSCFHPRTTSPQHAITSGRPRSFYCCAKCKPEIRSSSNPSGLRWSHVAKRYRR